MIPDNSCSSEYDLTVIIPTYNEEGNIREIVSQVDSVCRSSNINEEILVVDDDSPDGTQIIVSEMQESMKNLHILVRYEDHGLSQSLHAGIYKAESCLVQCIDADLSHPPEKIPVFYNLLKNENYDMVIGSRYIPGGETFDWPLYRKIISSGAALIGRSFIPIVKDSGSGFFAINRRILEDVNLKPRGFRMGFEILGKARWENVTEIPIVFRDRVAGVSKIKPSVFSDFLLQCMHIAYYNFILRKSGNIIKSWKRFLFGRKN
ncbi:polyprenol monophosphomannose synthase [Methanolacinia petrolearia]|uniref:polyprenol monophosphomannose synthase n=1 Tax=Methanolacinia petrolearia TaxID=54120 RepID=UPI003BA93DB8